MRTQACFSSQQGLTGMMTSIWERNGGSINTSPQGDLDVLPTSKTLLFTCLRSRWAIETNNNTPHEIKSGRPKGSYSYIVWIYLQVMCTSLLEEWRITTEPGVSGSCKSGKTTTERTRSACPVKDFLKILRAKPRKREIDGIFDRDVGYF